MIYSKCRKFILLIWLINISLSVGLLAQTTINKMIDSISFQGIEKNKENYLNQFIESKMGGYPSDSLLLEDVQRLKNIPSIGNANYRLDTTNQSVAIVFQIEEVKTINWQGNGSFLSAIYQNRDRRHGGQIYYRAARIKGSDWGISATLNKLASLEPLFFSAGTVNYNYTNYEAGLTVIKQFGFRHQLEFGGTYFIEKYEKSKYQILENPVGPTELTQPKYLSKIEYTSNFLDYHFFYLKGFYWKAALQNVYNTSDKSWFQSLQFSGKYFSRIGEGGNLALRLHAGIATNNNSPFAPYVVDSHTNLRGVGNRTARGTAQFIINAEYRFTTYETKKWGIQVVTFLDIGAWRPPGGKLEASFDTAQFKQFMGNGLRFIYKKIYGTVLRIDYGINIQNIDQSGFVIGFGQYFFKEISSKARLFDC